MHAHEVRHTRHTLPKAARLGVLFCLCLGIPGPAPRAEPAQRLSYTRDVRPILAAHCFNCHGLDEESRQADLRLDLREPAVAPRDSGRPAIVPGKPAASGVTARIHATDETLVMPPPEFKKPLTPAQVATLERWIAEGATYEPHWAFTAPVRPALPPSAAGKENPIDAFVRQRLAAAGLKPAPPAGRETWLRRVTLDLTGVPPTPAERAAFLADTGPDAHDKVVDLLLSSPRHAERMALHWLDAARYADTNGYNNDAERSQWPWRDWVIDAFARNLPYDRFVVEQVAGDLLPDATQAQRIATGFGRNHVLTTEGGIIDEEYRIEYVADRIQTTASAFMAVTLQCARCHDHKFDPISQRDYYGLFAFFNSLPDRPVSYSSTERFLVADPVIVIHTAADQAERDRLTGRLAELERGVKEAAAAPPTPPTGDAAQGTPQPAPAPPAAALDDVRKQLAVIENRAARVMVMADLSAPRPTRLLHRGQYDQPRDTIHPGVPAGFPPLPEGVPRNRLALARWLVDPRHPLTARVAVNRWWEMLFGRGLVATVEDFGTQGEPPSHQELLDWLAVDLVEGGWDVRRILRMIVLSDTYRQSSAAAAEAFARDPDNRLLARGPRFRLPAEVIRDQALFAAGLLVEQVGGPSVKPYQPAGLWEEVSVEHKARYVPDAGPGLHRRSMYTFWKRTCPPPGMTLFDAPDREVCSVRRPRTTTPLQSLVLMNDPTYVEAARSLAASAIAAVPADAGRTGPARDASILTEAFLRLLGREPEARERDLLLERLADFRRRFAGDRGAAGRLLGVGTVRPPAAIATDELAGWSMVMSLLLCFDETLTKG